jgi:peptidoglycan-N-acetylglucosamine deacetylase
MRSQLLEDFLTPLNTPLNMPQSTTRPRIVTTSWDDGERYDLKVAEILRSKQIRGTFYIPIIPYLGRPTMSPAELRALAAEDFEIGAHGFSHKYLWKLPPEELAREINPCKPILEDITGKEVRMFCYPRGRYDVNVVRALKEAGYRGARTVRMLATRLEFAPFEMPTTIQISRHTRYTYIKNIARGRTFEGLRVYLANRDKASNWLDLGKSLFDSVMENGGIWHLYGHSKEIEEFGLWKDLEEILDYVGKRKEVTYLPNWQLIQTAHATETRSLSRTQLLHPEAASIPCAQQPVHCADGETVSSKTV